MQIRSIGKIRGLQRCTSSQGIFTSLALDHRQNLRKSLNPLNPDKVTDGKLTEFKLKVASALAHHSTAVLLDPEFSAVQAVAAGILPKEVGLVVAVEATGYLGETEARKSRILPGWSLEKAKRMGADMVKLLVYFHPDAYTANEVIAFVKKTAEKAEKLDLGLMLEPLSYSLDLNRKILDSEEKRYVVIESARQLIFPGIDVLKCEFPLNIDENNAEEDWKSACEELTNTSTVPWILLSAAVDFQTYMNQVKIACKSGASGIAVGRAVWKEAVNLRDENLDLFLRTEAITRLEKLSLLCSSYARPYTEVFSSPSYQIDWYKSY